MAYPILSHISRQHKLKRLMPYLRASDVILEIGSSSGWFSSQLRQRGYQVVSLDIHAPATIVGDVTQWRDLDIEAHSFDIVVALEVIEHVDCLGALRMLCKPGGLIMLSSPHPRWDWLMKCLEVLHLTQKRTSAHINLTDFSTISLPAVVRKRPLYIHQVALFRNQEFYH